MPRKENVQNTHLVFSTNFKGKCWGFLCSPHHRNAVKIIWRNIFQGLSFSRHSQPTKPFPSIRPSRFMPLFIQRTYVPLNSPSSQRVIVVGRLLFSRSNVPNCLTTLNTAGEKKEKGRKSRAEQSRAGEDERKAAAESRWMNNNWPWRKEREKTSSREKKRNKK